MEKNCPTCGGTNLQTLFGGSVLRCMNRQCPDYKRSKAYGMFLPQVASPSPQSPQPEEPGYGKLLGGGPLPMPLARNAKERLEQLKGLGVVASKMDASGLHQIADRLDRLTTNS